jgi:hypothetical protein
MKLIQYSTAFRFITSNGRKMAASFRKSAMKFWVERNVGAEQEEPTPWS